MFRHVIAFQFIRNCIKVIIKYYVEIPLLHFLIKKFKFDGIVKVVAWHSSPKPINKNSRMFIELKVNDSGRQPV